MPEQCRSLSAVIPMGMDEHLRCLLHGEHPKYQHYAAMEDDPDRFWTWTDEEESGRFEEVREVDIVHMRHFKDGYPLCWPMDRDGPYTGTHTESAVTCRDCIKYMEE